MISKTVILLKPYQNLFSKPQFNHFKFFLQGLMSCEIPTVNRMSQLQSKDRSCMARFLTESPWDLERIKSAYHKQIEPFIRKGSALLIDDTNSKRPYAKKVEKANYHFDHTTGKDVLGYCLVTATISSDYHNIPYEIMSYYRECDCNDKVFRTKNDIAEMIIESTANLKNISLVIVDTWYSNEQVIGACKRVGKDFITQIKSNRNITLNRRERAVRAHANHIGEKDWEITVYKNSVFRYFSTSAFISSISSVHLIFCQKWNEKENKWGETHYLISNLLDTSSNILLHKYLDRVGIEQFHRNAKQNLGLEGYYLRNNRGIERYLFLVMLAFGFLVMLNMINKTYLTIGELCEEQKVIVLKNTIAKIRKNPEFEDVLIRKLAMARV